MSWTVSSPQPERHPPQARYLRSEVVLSLLFVQLFPVTQARCFSDSSHVAGVTLSENSEIQNCTGGFLFGPFALLTTTWLGPFPRPQLFFCPFSSQV